MRSVSELSFRDTLPHQKEFVDYFHKERAPAQTTTRGMGRDARLAKASEGGRMRSEASPPGPRQPLPRRSRAVQFRRRGHDRHRTGQLHLFETGEGALHAASLQGRQVKGPELAGSARGSGLPHCGCGGPERIQISDPMIASSQ